MHLKTGPSSLLRQCLNKLKLRSVPGKDHTKAFLNPISQQCHHPKEAIESFLRFQPANAKERKFPSFGQPRWFEADSVNDIRKEKELVPSAPMRSQPRYCVAGIGCDAIRQGQRHFAQKPAISFQFTQPVISHRAQRWNAQDL